QIFVPRQQLLIYGPRHVGQHARPIHYRPLLRTDPPDGNLDHPENRDAPSAKRLVSRPFQFLDLTGYGDPLRRAPDHVAADVLNGYVSVERARSDYGVVVDAGGALDLVATEREREGRRAARQT